jgi:uncharacterized repeat protein (TIGR03803 family)
MNQNCELKDQVATHPNRNALFRHPWTGRCSAIWHALCAFALLAMATSQGYSQAFTVLHDFGSLCDTCPAYQPVLAGTTLYGTTTGGCPYGGTLYRINIDGTGYAVLTHGYSGPLAVSGRTVYGTGFKFAIDGSVFTQFAFPVPGTVRSLIVTNGMCYGTTYNSDGNDRGAIFKVDTNGNGYATLKVFTGPDGNGPWGQLVMTGTNLFGTTILGGAYGDGAIYRLSADGSGFTVLHSFNGSDGNEPYGGLTLVGQSLYGTVTGSTTGFPFHSLFKINMDGSGFAVLDADSPYTTPGSFAQMVNSGSRLYGTTTGSIFVAGLDGTGYAVLQSFDNSNGTNGFYLDSGLAMGSNAVFGVTHWGGTGFAGGTTGSGVIFSLSVAPPSLLQPPASQTVLAGSTANFTIQAGGPAPLNYQWLFQETNLIAGATNAVLILTNVQPSNSGAYSAVVGNLFGSITSAPAWLVVTGGAPVIVMSPGDQSVGVGSTVNLATEASGTSPLIYQWFFNHTNSLPGATNALLQLFNVQTNQSGIYTVVVTNRFGTATSPPTVLAISAGIVINCTEANLRTALAGGGTVVFACDGTITLTNSIEVMQDLVLDGTGHQITLSGNHAVPLFYVNTNTSLTLSNLTLADGYAAGTFATTGYVPDDPDLVGRGGGIFNQGSLVLANCVFTNNQAVGGYVFMGYGGSGQGGAIFNQGTNIMDNCVFSGNSTLGGNGGSPNYGFSAGGGGAGEGGAIYNAGSLTISRSSFTNNAAAGWSGAAAQPMPNGMSGELTGGAGGAASGGAIYNSGSLLLQSSTVAENTTRGGAGGMGGTGGSSYYPMYSGNEGDSGGTGGGGGAAAGAIFNSGAANLLNTTVALNHAGGGSGGTGGVGGPTTVRLQDWAGGGGGAGGSGGSGLGGICDTSGNLQMTNCTVASNLGVPGAGGSGGTGGLGTAPNFPLGPAGSVGASGTAVGGVKTVACDLANTLLANNQPLNWSGTVMDAGHNLSSDASCAFSGGGSMNNTDPRLGPLADNGGPTLTMALLPGSPAIDSGSVAGGPATDQRGVARPQGPAADIGAFEYQYIPLFARATTQGTTNCLLQMSGLLPQQIFTLQVSSNFLNWSTVTSFTSGTNGLSQLSDPMPPNWPTRLYRVKSGAP